MLRRLERVDVVASYARQVHSPSWQLQERGKAFPPNYLHETWRDWLYWDVELES